MPVQEKEHRNSEGNREVADSNNPEETSVTVKEGAVIKDEIDKLIDEIEDLVDQNSEEFIDAYVQQGGE